MPASRFVGVGVTLDATHLSSKNRRFSATFSSCVDAGVAVPNYVLGYWYNECAESNRLVYPNGDFNGDGNFVNAKNYIIVRVLFNLQRTPLNAITDNVVL